MSLAQWSNLFVYAAMAMYALAFISFAVSFAASRTATAEGATSDADLGVEPVEVLSGATGVAAGTAARTADGPGDPLPSAASPADAAARARAEARARSAQLEAEMAAEARRVGRRGRTDRSGAAQALPPGRRASNIAMSLTWLACALLLAGLVTRGLWAGRAPWGNMYEYSLASALAITGVFLGVSLRRDVRWLGLLVTMASLITLGVAVLLLYNDSPQLVPALHSYWLVIHVSAAIISGGAFTVGAAATVLYLIADRADRRADARFSRAIAERIPDAVTLDTLAYRVNAFVFPLWTFAVIAGAIWAEDAWGRYWGWDPKETWAFITWLIYAGYLHARATAGWRGRKAAVIALIGFASFLINFFGVNLFVSGLHSYAGV
ncbi:MAG TPA: c-type cytochrome biogenesis protein CcsB [Candidatus Nanopelagicales bacterium]